MNELDPNTLHCPAGRVLIHITEKLGGMTAGGVYKPPSAEDNFSKDTAYGAILKKGRPPGEKPGETGTPWSDEYASATNIGDIVVFPRDVPFAFVWEGERYAMVYEHELMYAIAPEDFDSFAFEVVPWRNQSTWL